MHFNLVDILALAYTAYGAARGWWRGIGRELSKAIGAAVACGTGIGLYSWTGKLLSGVSHMTGQTVSRLGFVGVLFGSYFLVQQLRGRIRAWAEKRLPGENIQKRAGLIAGVVRTLIIASTVILFFSHSPIGPVSAPFKDGSLLGRVLNRFIPPAHDASRQEFDQRPVKQPD